jgi:hypothetical protein
MLNGPEPETPENTNFMIYNIQIVKAFIKK